MMAKKKEPEKADALAIPVVPATAPAIIAAARSAYETWSHLLPLLTPVDRFEIESRFGLAQSQIPHHMASPPTPPSATPARPGYKFYGCLEIKDDFNFLYYRGKPCSLNKVKKAKGIIRFLCEKNAVGDNAEFVPGVEIEAYLLANKIICGKSKFRFDQAFNKSQQAKALLRAFKPLAPKVGAYRIKSMSESAEEAD